MVENYVDMLKQELLDRKKRSSLYSERAFARDLNVSSGFISLLFNGKRGLSPRTSVKIIKSLNWDESKVKKFMDSVQSSQFLESKKSAPQKSFISEHEIELDQFRLISNLNHFVVLELVQNRKIKKIEDLTKYLGIDKIEADMILKRLVRLGMIDLDKRGYRAATTNRKLKDTPSEAIRSYHKQALEMADAAIDEQDFSLRELRALTLSLDPKKVDQAKKHMSSFVKSFNKKFGNKKNGEIYQLNLQLFSHSKKKEK